MNPEWQARYELAVEAAESAAKIAAGYFPDGDTADFAARVEWKFESQSRHRRRPRRRGVSAQSSHQCLSARRLPRRRVRRKARRQRLSLDRRSDRRHAQLHTRDAVVGHASRRRVSRRGHRGCRRHAVARLQLSALRGDGAYRNGRRLHVSETATLDDAVLVCSSLSGFIKAGREIQFLELARQTQRQRAFGNFYGFVLIAEGAADVMVEQGIHVWDVAAVAPIIEEAGGRFTDWDGQATIHRPDVIASNGKLHDATLRILNGTPSS